MARIPKYILIPILKDWLIFAELKILSQIISFSNLTLDKDYLIIEEKDDLKNFIFYRKIKKLSIYANVRMLRKIQVLFGDHLEQLCITNKNISINNNTILKLFTKLKVLIFDFDIKLIYLIINNKACKISKLNNTITI